MNRVLSILTILFTCFSTAFAQPNITLEDIWGKGTFRSDYVYGLNSMKDGLHYTTLDRDRGGNVINKYSYKTGELVEPILQSIVLLPEGEEKPLSIGSYSFSADENQVLIGTELESVYRHSTKGQYYIYDLKSEKLIKLTNGEKQRLAEFSPDGKRVAFVKENNLYVKSLETNQEFQITNDGEWNKIINGGTDWVYEEEFGFDQAFFWSPDGKKVAYYRFDEEAVKQFNMAMYGQLYPNQYEFKYPKAGEENAKVEIKIFDIVTKKSISASIENYEYIPRIKWANANQLSVITLNRNQNDLNLFLVDGNTGKANLILNEKSNAYIDIDDDLSFLPENKGFIWTSDENGFKHIYKYSLDGKKKAQVTSGNWQVDEYLGYDSTSDLIYFSSTEASPTERNIYSIKSTGKSKTNLTPLKGWNDANFSNGFKYFINTYSTVNQPSVITLNDNTGKVIRTLKNNENLNKTLQEFDLSPTEFTSLKISENLSLNAYIIKPKDFDENKKYPVLMHVYGGPGSQTVKNQWLGSNFFWHQMLSQQGYIIVSVDNRGTGARGAEFQKVTYKELGKYETQDQIAAAQKLAELPYVDASRIGIWGWSYGGYMSSLCLFKGANVFKTAIAVAPVTNWRFYDSIYTERYMQTPQENANGYDDNSPINHVDSLKGNFLLVHGSADDNVHYQNTMEMTTALVNANKQFDLMIYPNKNHGIYGGNTRYHLYKKMTDFILENL